MISINQERGTDFVLRMLGIEDRADWTIAARDNRNYVTDLVYGRPDWVLRNIKTGAYRVYDYKNRALEDSDATEYEKFQALIYAIIVADTVGRETGAIPEVTAHLLYADNHSLQVEYDADELNLIGLTAPEASTALYFLGVTPEPKQRVSASNLARYLVDPQFSNPSFGRVAVQRAGTRAHDVILHNGPVFH